MFDPVSLGIMAAGSIASTLFGASSARKAAKAQANLQIAQIKYALQNFSQQANANNTKYSQEQEAAYEQAQQIYLENLKAKSTAQTSSAGSGVAGNSIENLFKNYDRATALSNFITERNLRNLGWQYDSNYEALRANAINSIYGLQGYTGQSASSIISQGIFDLGKLALSYGGKK